MAKRRPAATVEQFKKFIYEQGSAISLGDYVSAAFRRFPTRRGDVDIDTRLSVLTEAWNYFPHRARGGKCPAELLAVENEGAAAASCACGPCTDNARGWDGVSHRSSSGLSSPERSLAACQGCHANII